MTSSLLLIFAFVLRAASADQSNNPRQDVIVWPDGMPPAGITHKEDFGNHILSISHREKMGARSSIRRRPIHDRSERGSHPGVRRPGDRPTTLRAQRDTRQRESR